MQPNKKDILLDILERSTAYLQIDGRAAGVVLPEHLRANPSVILQVGYQMAIPIVDLKLDDEGWRGTLSFARSPFHCQVPWSAVYGVADDEGQALIFREDVPADLGGFVTAAELEGTGLAPVPAEGEKVLSAGSAPVAGIPGASLSWAVKLKPTDRKPPPEGGPAGGSHLKLVK